MTMSEQGTEDTRPQRPIPVPHDTDEGGYQTRFDDDAPDQEFEEDFDFDEDAEDDYERLSLEFPPPHPRLRTAEGHRGGSDGTGGSGFHAGTREFRVIGIIALLAVVAIALILPPIRILNRIGGNGSAAGQGYTTRARSSMPALPEGLEAASALYDIQGSGSVQGPVTLTVRLTKATQDTRALAFYTYTNNDWLRLASVTATEDGKSVRGDIISIPPNIAVLRRGAFAYQFGAIIGPGDTLDPAATDAGIVSVLAGEPSAGDEGLQISDRLSGTLQGRYLGLTTGTATGAAAINRILNDTAATGRHIDAIVGAATATQAAGIHIDYLGIDPARRDAFTTFIARLAERLKADNRGLVVTVPTPAGTTPDAYDWAALAKSANAVWLRAPADPAAYYDQMETSLRSHRENGVDLSRISLIIDRRSRERAGDVIRAMTLRDALTTASAVRAHLDPGIAPGEKVNLSGTNIDQDAGNSGLRWDDRSRSVMFSYAGALGAQSIWIENRFSIAFRLDLARRYHLGGVVVEGATHDETLPDAWNTILAFTNDGQLALQTPYGPYLQPSWRVSEGQIEAAAGTGAAIWRAPARTGTFQVTLIISDGVVFVGQQLALNVTADGGRTPTPTPAASATATPAR
jgi:hypothetical protein